MFGLLTFVLAEIKLISFRRNSYLIKAVLDGSNLQFFAYVKERYEDAAAKLTKNS